MTTEGHQKPKWPLKALHPKWSLKPRATEK